MMADVWVVAKTKPQRERYAAEHVQRQGHEFYLPSVLEKVKSKTGGYMAIAKPLFPSFLFVRTDGQWRFLLATYGLVGVVLQGASAAILTDDEMVRLRQREGPDGLIHLPTRGQCMKFKVGDPIRIARSGHAFDGYQGLYEGMQGPARSRILLDYLGRKVRVLVAEVELESV